MSYNYYELKDELFTDDGQRRFIKIRDKILALIKSAGAFRLAEAEIVAWEDIACVDRMVELGELVEWPRECWGQFRTFTTPQVHNL